MNTAIKYRPRTLDDFIFATPTLRSTVKMYASGATNQPLILHGTHGTGKSLLAELIPKAIDGEDVAVEKFTVDDLKSRTSIKQKLMRGRTFDSLFQAEGQSRCYKIFDEFVMDSKMLKDEVRLAMDDMTEHDLYIFTTNELNKLDSGVLSRSLQLLVPPVSPTDFLEKAQKILRSEGVDLPDVDVLRLLEAVHHANADNRKFYEFLDKIIFETKGV